MPANTLHTAGPQHVSVYERVYDVHACYTYVDSLMHVICMTCSASAA